MYAEVPEFGGEAISSGFMCCHPCQDGPRHLPVRDLCPDCDAVALPLASFCYPQPRDRTAPRLG